VVGALPLGVGTPPPGVGQLSAQKDGERAKLCVPDEGQLTNGLPCLMSEL